MRRLALLVWFSIAACTKATPPPKAPAAPPPAGGTCASICMHYFDCKGVDPTSDDLAVCARECEKGPADPEQLKHFESLDCPTAIAVIEGDPSLPGTGRRYWQAGSRAGRGLHWSARPRPSWPWLSPPQQKTRGTVSSVRTQTWSRPATTSLTPGRP